MSVKNGLIVKIPMVVPIMVVRGIRNILVFIFFRFWKVDLSVPMLKLTRSMSRYKLYRLNWFKLWFVDG